MTESKIKQLISQDPIDLQELHKISRLPGGFCNNILRQRVWPKLLGINRYDVLDFRNLIRPHRDTNQVICDIERSLWSLEETLGWTNSLRDRRRDSLLNIIMALLCTDQSLYYYQGFHDVVSVFLLVLEDDYLTFHAVEALSKQFLSDCMTENFDSIARLMKIILVVISYADESLYNFLLEAQIEPYFATSWFITWFSHDLKQIDKIARIFDLLLCSHPIYSLYLCSSLVILHRQEIMTLDCDFATVHSFLSKLPRTHGIAAEVICKVADDLFVKYPPEQLKRIFRASEDGKKDL